MRFSQRVTSVFDVRVGRDVRGFPCPAGLGLRKLRAVPLRPAAGNSIAGVALDGGLRVMSLSDVS